TERRSADLRYGESARRDDERLATHGAERRRDGEAVVVARNAVDCARYRPLHVSPRAFRLQHRDDVVRGIVAEELSEFLFVVADAVTVYEIDEMRCGVARQCRAAEVRVLRQIVCR